MMKNCWFVTRKQVKRHCSCSYTSNVWQFLLVEAHHVGHNYFLFDCGSSRSNECFLSSFFSCGAKLIQWIQCSIYLFENDSLKFDVSCPCHPQPPPWLWSEFLFGFGGHRSLGMEFLMAKYYNDEVFNFQCF